MGARRIPCPAASSAGHEGADSQPGQVGAEQEAEGLWRPLGQEAVDTYPKDFVGERHEPADCGHSDGKSEPHAGRRSRTTILQTTAPSPRFKDAATRVVPANPKAPSRKPAAAKAPTAAPSVLAK